MEIFHNINSKVKPLTTKELYKGFFELFNVDELEKFGKEFSITKAFINKHGKLVLNNLQNYLTNKEDMISSCVKFIIDRFDVDFTEDDVCEILSVLEHTYFTCFPVLRDCKNKFSLIPYFYYCFEGGKTKKCKIRCV